jgi:BirA family biotin operon repressor/biotin-[acetyl-CoA-carboxylase] ligase
VELLAFDTLDSTNLEARRRWNQRNLGGRHDPLLIVARTQSGGLGRAGRNWLSPPGGLWMSLAWALKDDLEEYQAAPLLAGLATAEAIEDVCDVACQIKWPNDVLVRQRKLVGILCQGEPDLPVPAIILGIGVNANFASEDLGAGLRHPPISIQDMLGRPIDLDALRDGIAGNLARYLANLEEDPIVLGAMLIRRIEERLAWSGQEVRCSDVQGHVLASGILEGLTAEGCAMIMTTGGLETLAIGELQLRPGAEES